jgi:hypothetical protein
MGYKEYESFVGDAFSRIIKPHIDNDAQSFGELLINRFYGLTPDSVPPRKIQVQERLLSAHLTFSVDIGTALEDLKAFAIYIRRFPYTNAGISKVAYLRHNIEGYLQAIYVFKERVKKHLRRFKRIWDL